MDNLTYEPIIKVDVADGEKSVKSLKAEISKLRDHILNLTEGTEEYNFAVKKLQSDQRDLDKVMSLTKTTATALEGSYDALVHQMSLLKKEFKATNDEARRNELATQINAINDQLKELDGSMGSWTRNVGNYQSALDGMDTSTKSFKESLGQMNDSIEPTKAKFESVQKISSGVASGFAAVQGAAALLGSEGEDLQKVFVKVQSAMAIAQGVGGLGDLVEGVGKAKVAFEGLGDKIKAVSKVMGKAGWIGVIVTVTAAIATLVTYLIKKNEEIKNGTAAIKEYNKAVLEEVEGVGKEITNLRLLEQIASDTNLEMNQRLVASQELCKQLGLQWTEENKLKALQGDLKTETENATAAIIEQAKARAALAMIESKAGEVVSLEVEKEQIKQTGPTKKDARQARKYNNAVMQSGSDAPLVTATDIMNDRIAAKDKAISQLTTEMDAILTAAGIGVLNEIANGGGTVEETEEQKAAKAAAAARAAAIKAANEERDRLVAEILSQEIEVPDEPIEKLDTTVQMQEEGEVYKETKAAMLAIEETYAGDSLKIEERKLERLKELHQKAVDVGDDKSQLLLAQDIADQEVALNDAKNDAIVASDEAAAQKRIDIINKVAQAISAASSVTQGILEITQAAAEKDGEITEKEAKRIKGLQIAIATMNMLQGITSALSGVFTTHTGPWDIAMAAAQAVSIAAAGTANIMKIRNTDLTGSVTSGAQAAVTPNSNIYGTDIPMSYVRNVTGQSEVDALNQDTRVYILESDIQESNRRVKVRQSESSF